MPSTFVGIETALRGLNASQQALEITGHNITNASTAGYTRETANFSTTAALQIAPGELMGTGVGLIVSDHPLSGETNDGTDFIVLTR